MHRARTALAIAGWVLLLWVVAELGGLVKVAHENDWAIFWGRYVVIEAEKWPFNPPVKVGLPPTPTPAPVPTPALTARDRAELKMKCLELATRSGSFSYLAANRCLSDLGEPLLYQEPRPSR